MLISSLAAAGLVAAFSAPARAQEYRNDGTCEAKQEWCTDEPGRVDGVPYTSTVVVSRRDRHPGDIRGFRYVGKTMEPVYLRTAPWTGPVVNDGPHWRLHYVGKTTAREYYTVENGVEKPYFARSRHHHHHARK
ncbi:MAG: hypothetical protein JO332_06855 [Planctomycetaceae bacterium]|nr:hypothetical protein [Planctomycetaceae bacterium]